jgi:cytochrome P450 PksS
MTAEVDFTSQAFFRDPAAGVERLRALGPVVATRFPIVGKVWITTTYEATARVLKDGETFTLRKEGGGLAGLRWWMPSFVAALANNMLTMDEPDHTRLREIVDEAFRRRSSASCSACRWPTGRNTSPGRIRSRGSRESPISCA